jgi:hypothetical protein
MACSCNISIENTGTAGCKNIMEVAKMPIFVSLFDKTGIRNGIAIADVLNEQYFTDLINEPDKLKRWYPLPLVENVEDVKADPIVEGLNSGKNIIVQEGTRMFTAVIIKESNTLIGKLKSFGCKEFGVYFIDNDGNLVGEISADGQTLYPIRVDNNTLDVRLIKSSDTTVQKIQVKFEFHQTSKDENLTMITADEMTSVNMLLLEGLLDVNADVIGSSATSLTVALTLDYGTFKNKIKALGWVAADFDLYNVTDDLPISILTAPEVSDGVYNITFASQGAGDVVELTSNKDGYELKALQETI